MAGRMAILTKIFHGRSSKKHQTSVFTGLFVSMEEIVEETSMQNHGNKGRSHQDDVWELLNAIILPATSLFDPRRHLTESISSLASLATVVPCLNTKSAMSYHICGAGQMGFIIRMEDSIYIGDRLVVTTFMIKTRQVSADECV
jgi:hypothetical protein